MRYPDGLQVQDVGEDVVGQRSAEIGQDGRRSSASALERAAGPAHPRIRRIEAACIEMPALCRSHLDRTEAVAIEMATQRWDDVVDVGADHIAKLTMRACDAGDGVHRTLRRPRKKGQDLKAVPAEYAFGRRQAGLAQSRSIRGPPGPPSTSTPASACRTDA